MSRSKEGTTEVTFIKGLHVTHCFDNCGLEIFWKVDDKLKCFSAELWDDPIFKIPRKFEVMFHVWDLERLICNYTLSPSLTLIHNPKYLYLS